MYKSIFKLFLSLLALAPFGVQSQSFDKNFYACNSGFATCNQSLLTDVQKQQVHQSALSRNYNACNSGFATCNQSLLTDVQKQEIDLRRTNSELKSNNNHTETNTGLSGNRPLCAENGSCYGDISNITGLPKTTHVNGYYRKDGTYVRGHYRSRR